VSRPLPEEVATLKLLLADVAASLECADLCASCESIEQDSLMVVVDVDVVIEMTPKTDDEAIVGKALKDSAMVGKECIFVCFSPCHNLPTTVV
jgi:hypothetical protein